MSSFSFTVLAKYSDYTFYNSRCFAFFQAFCMIFTALKIVSSLGIGGVFFSFSLIYFFFFFLPGFNLVGDFDFFFNLPGFM